MNRAPLTPQAPETAPSVHAPGAMVTRRYSDDPQAGTAPTRGPYGLLRHRRATLHGGPLNGQTVRIYPERDNEPNGHVAEPPDIVICMAIVWPHWEPTAWLDYHRHDDGTYHWIGDQP